MNKLLQTWGVATPINERYVPYERLYVIKCTTQIDIVSNLNKYILLYKD